MIEKTFTDSEIQAQFELLTNELLSHGIPLDQWGIGKAKTINHLVKEILEEEAELVDRNGELVRKVEIAHVDVLYTLGGTILQLIEDKQIFKNGRERRRGLHGISEKMKPGEVPLESAKRALDEELDIKTENIIEYIGSENETKHSSSYPGLVTEYLKHEMRTILRDEDFKSEGYIENQSDKSTFFIWKESELG